MLSWLEPAPSGKEGTRTKISLVTPNGAGKSERIVASAALWWASCHKRGKVVITTKDAKQLDNQVWPAITKHRGKFQGWRWNEREIYTASGGKITAFTTDEPGRAEGYHHGQPIHHEPLLYIVDEAKSVDELIFQAIDRCTWDALLYVSSPGKMQGRFYDSQTKHRDQFKCLHVGLKDCPHIPKEKIADLESLYPADHPFLRSTLHGEFMPEDGANFLIFPMDELNRCMESPPRWQSGTRRAFCDFAAGGDENVVAVADGNKVEIVASWKDRNTVANTGRFLIEFKKAGLKEGEVYGDEGGMGRNYCDSLASAGFNVHRVNNGSRPLDDRYINRGAEMWHQTAAMVRRSEVILPEGDETLKAQLITRKTVINKLGKLGIESKEDMLKRGLSSPDRADAVCGALAAKSYAPVSTKIQVHSWLEELNEMNDRVSTLAGMDPGE